MSNAGTAVCSFRLASKYQSDPTSAEVLLPDRPDPAAAYPVLYILPVVEAGKRTYGDGFEEAKKADVANRYGLLCVRPCFTVVPWYGDHASNPRLRQEAFVLRTLIPWVDSHYPTRRARDGRWLVGFSKSGWGAFALLMRHPQIFGYAASWDAPMMLDGSDPYWRSLGIERVFGTRRTMLPYLPTTLARTRADRLARRRRLVLGPGRDWREHSCRYHQLLQRLRIPHVYRSDLLFEHRWDTGWFAPMVQELAGVARAAPACP